MCETPLPTTDSATGHMALLAAYTGNGQAPCFHQVHLSATAMQVCCFFYHALETFTWIHLGPTRAPPESCKSSPANTLLRCLLILNPCHPSMYTKGRGVVLCLHPMTLTSPRPQLNLIPRGWPSTLQCHWGFLTAMPPQIPLASP